MHCGIAGYLIGYGRKYCKRFDVTREYFDPPGQKWIDCARQCLIDFLKPYYNTYPNNPFRQDCQKLEDAAFTSHVDCYTKCGFCKICKNNKMALFKTYNIADFFSALAWRQVKETMEKCGGFFSCF